MEWEKKKTDKACAERTEMQRRGVQQKYEKVKYVVTSE